MNIEKIIDKVIPPNTHTHREGFNNTYIINQLDEGEKSRLEEELINRILRKSNDMLIVETLAYLRSEKALPVLYACLKRTSVAMDKLIVASSIFEINKDNCMIDVAISSFKRLESAKTVYYMYALIPAFYYLVKFGSIEVMNIVEKYTTHTEYLISYNAKQALASISNKKE